MMAPPAQPKRSLSLRQNFAWNFFGNVIYAGCQWGIMVVLAKLTSPEKLGQFALGLAVTAPIILFSQLQLRGVQATDARGNFEFGHYLALRLLTTGLALAVIWGVAGWGGYDRATCWIILAIGWSKGVDSLKDVYYGLMQRHERMDRMAQSRIAGGVLALGCLAGLIWNTRSVVAGVLGMVVAQFAVWLIYDRQHVRRLLVTAPREPGAIRPLFDAKILWHLAILALPLGLVMMILSLNTNIPRYFIEHYEGVAQLGIFAALSYVVVAGNTFIIALGQAALPQLAKCYAAGNCSSYKRILGRMVIMGLAVGTAGVLMAWLAGPWILAVVYGPEYARQNRVFIVLMGVGAVQYVASFMGYGMTAAHYFRAQLPLFACVCLATAVASFICIPCWGVMGAAMALLVGACCNIIGCTIVVVHAIRHIPPEPEVK
jgi:O-antigen/teichoic acid export membrane protein